MQVAINSKVQGLSKGVQHLHQFSTAVVIIIIIITVAIIIVIPRIDGMQGGHEHEGELDGQEDGDDDDQHQGRVVRVSLSLVLSEIGDYDHDDADVNEMMEDVMVARWWVG